MSEISTVVHHATTADPTASVQHYDPQGRPLDLVAGELVPRTEGSHQTIGGGVDVRAGAIQGDGATRVEIADVTTAADVRGAPSLRDAVTRVVPSVPLGGGGEVRAAPAAPPGGAVTASPDAGGVEIRDVSRRPQGGAIPARPARILPTGPVPTGDGRTTVTTHGLDPRFKGDPSRDPEAYAQWLREELADAEAAKGGI